MSFRFDADLTGQATVEVAKDVVVMPPLRFQIVVNPDLPQGEMQFVQDGKVVGRITNIGEVEDHV